MGAFMNYDLEAARLKKDWAENPRWKGIQRGYTAEDVVKLRGSVHIEHTLARARRGKLWKLLNEEPFVNTLGALTGNQAMQQVKAGSRRSTCPDGRSRPTPTSPARCIPTSRCIRSTRCRTSCADQQHLPARRPDPAHGRQAATIDFFAPIVADARSRVRRRAQRFELMKAMIEAGAAGVHFEDQLASVKKCGHMGGKVLVPTREGRREADRRAARADCMGVPTILLARTDAEAADLVTSDVDENDKPFCTGERTSKASIARATARAGGVARPRVRAVRRPDLVRDRQAGPRVREAVRRSDPGEVPGQDAGVQLLAVVQLAQEPRRRDDRRFQRELGAMGYKFQFITLAGFHSLNYSMFNLAHGYARDNMKAFVELQEAEFAAADKGFTAVKHQREVGTGYFDAVTTTVQGSHRRPRR
jgi:isocitrate lyase